MAAQIVKSHPRWLSLLCQPSRASAPTARPAQEWHHTSHRLLFSTLLPFFCCYFVAHPRRSFTPACLRPFYDRHCHLTKNCSFLILEPEWSISQTLSSSSIFATRPALDCE